MRKLTREEADKLMLRKGSSSAVRTAVLHLQPGEILMIEKHDWKQKNGPGQMCSRITKSTGMIFTVSALASGEGWVVERVK
jgi:hypothetical protein